MKTLLAFFLFLFLFAQVTFSQVAVNTDGTAPNGSAMLDVNSADKGVLLPRLNYSQLMAIVSPASGLMVFCTDCGETGSGAMAIFINGTWNLLNASCLNPSAPVAGTHAVSYTQIVWNWNTVPGATGYKWSVTNDYASAYDWGTNTSMTELSLTCGTNYTRYAWAYNGCGHSSTLIMTQSTTACPSCPSSITINHIAGTVAPVTKTVTYGIVSMIPGEPSKCWITSNLGADHQATYKADATEASAGSLTANKDTKMMALRQLRHGRSPRSLKVPTGHLPTIPVPWNLAPAGVFQPIPNGPMWMQRVTGQTGTARGLAPI